MFTTGPIHYPALLTVILPSLSQWIINPKNCLIFTRFTRLYFQFKPHIAKYAHVLLDFYEDSGLSPEEFKVIQSEIVGLQTIVV